MEPLGYRKYLLSNSLSSVERSLLSVLWAGCPMFGLPLDVGRCALRIGYRRGTWERARGVRVLLQIGME